MEKLILQTDRTLAHPVGVFFFLFIVPWLAACSLPPKAGSLLIESRQEGSYEIYSVAGDASLQFVSEQMGHFNKPLTLSPGSYLILADCSHRHIIIHPGEQVLIRVHQVEFTPPHPASPEDLFTVQCSRYEKFQMKQQISNRFVFNLISDAVDFLVGMQPLRVVFRPPAEIKQTDSPENKVFRLSALQVDHWKEPQQTDEPPYFVSPAENLLSITQAQDFGHWQFLLPGSYTVEVNGTSQVVTLRENESRKIRPAGLQISATPATDLSLYRQIRGSPFRIELNDRHLFEVNNLYPVLPGKARLRLDRSGRTQQIGFNENIVTKKELHGVLVDSGCAPWEWECLGNTEVNVYLPNEHYPFLESISDVPILFPDSSVQIGLEGSKGLRYQVPENRKFTKLKIGQLRIIPKPSFKSGYITELARLESAGRPILGFSHDIPPDRVTTMPLLEGQYHLARYTYIQQENERSSSKIPVKIDAGETVIVELSYYLPEGRAKLLSRIIRQKLARSERQKLNHKCKNRLNLF